MAKVLHPFRILAYILVILVISANTLSNGPCRKEFSLVTTRAMATLRFNYPLYIWRYQPMPSTIQSPFWIDGEFAAERGRFIFSFDNYEQTCFNREGHVDYYKVYNKVEFSNIENGKVKLQYKYECARNATTDTPYCGPDILDEMQVLQFENEIILTLYGCKQVTINGTVMRHEGILILRPDDDEDDKEFMIYFNRTKLILKNLNITSTALITPKLIHDTTHCYNVEYLFKKLPELDKQIVNKHDPLSYAPKIQHIKNEKINYSAIIYISVGVLCSSVALTLICMLECQKKIRKVN